jgi:hypothetical protein
MRSSVLLTNNEAALELGVHPVTLSNWRAKKRGPRYTKLSDGRIGYQPDDLRSWRALAARYIKPEAIVQS